MSDKEVYGVVSLLLSLAGYAPYIRLTLARKIRPHFFSWLVWSLISLIAYLAQESGDAGPGAWAVGVSAACCSFIALCSIRHGERRVTRSDWLCLGGALLALPLWLFCKDPLAALAAVMVVDAFAYAITFRKSWADPYGEDPAIYLIDTVKYGFAILAMERYSLLTLAFPIFIIVVEGALAAVILTRRRRPPFPSGR